LGHPELAERFVLLVPAVLSVKQFVLFHKPVDFLEIDDQIPVLAQPVGHLDIAVVDEIPLQELLDLSDDLMVGKKPAVQCPRMGAGPGPLPAAGR
jgi:hypothetical protein